jgi:hypothetical protein
MKFELSSATKSQHMNAGAKVAKAAFGWQVHFSQKYALTSR